ncbi:MAG: TonB-dependent receptor [Proteobacteria bacterium]|nr:TonB-dependent receptor [Pseudomonadota bacterium]
MQRSLKGLAASVVMLSVLAPHASAEQVPGETQEMARADSTTMEETVVLGRLQSAAQSLLQDRIEDDALVDSLDSETISRMGDSTVAASLRRVSGLTLVGEKFVYVRGLGERYSSTSLNGAFIPSPDLTRNVIPLDVFPSSIVSALSVQKTFAPDISANYAGGAVDISTTPFPDQGLNFSAEIGGGWNSEADNLNSYAGGSDDKWGTDDGTRQLPSQILQGLQAYQGSIGVQSILAGLNRTAGGGSAAEAVAINNGYALALNRDMALTSASSTPDFDSRFTLGNTYDLAEGLEGGVQLSGAYATKWRNKERYQAIFSIPDEQFENESQTTYSVDMTATATLGLRYMDEHELTVASLLLRNSDDEVAISDFHNENRQVSSGLGFRSYRMEFEQREMLVNQINGEHLLGFNTKALLRGWFDWVPSDAQLKWFYSDASASSDIPNRVNMAFDTVVNPLTAVVQSETLKRDSSAVDYRFTALEDAVESYGWKAEIPFAQGRNELNIKFGYQHDRKLRNYAQREFGLGSVSAPDAALNGGIAAVLSDTNIATLANGFRVQEQGSGSRSYLAATMVDASYGMLDWTYDDSWRITAGARYEDYRQVALPWNVFGYTVDQPQLPTDSATLSAAAFANDDYFPSVALVYMSDWLAETFQLRLSISETAIRPDLREVTDASYQDPVTNELVNGNPDVVPSSVENIDLRAEWFFANGNNLTISLFNKKIADPIEYFESPASDTNTARTIVNAAQTKIQGVEIDGVLALGFIGGWAERYFVQGNATFQDTETVAGANADSPTNNVRPATGASDYVVNMMLGFDSMDGRHAANVLYNVFGERLYVAGRLGAPDGYEQPFHSLDLNYSFYPTDNWTVKLKVQNLLDETVEIERAGVVTFAENPGMAVALKVKYDF